MKIRHLTLGELIQRSADRLREAEKILLMGKDPFMESFQLKESSILIRLAVKFWLHIRFRRFKGKLSKRKLTRK